MQDQYAFVDEYGNYGFDFTKEGNNRSDEFVL